MNVEKCCAEHAGYDGLFGIYCNLPADHAGPHWDGEVVWAFADTVSPAFTITETLP